MAPGALDLVLDFALLRSALEGLRRDASAVEDVHFTEGSEIDWLHSFHSRLAHAAPALCVGHRSKRALPQEALRVGLDAAARLVLECVPFGCATHDDACRFSQHAEALEILVKGLLSGMEADFGSQTAQQRLGMPLLAALAAPCKGEKPEEEPKLDQGGAPLQRRETALQAVTGIAEALASAFSAWCSAGRASYSCEQVRDAAQCYKRAVDVLESVVVDASHLFVLACGAGEMQLLKSVAVQGRLEQSRMLNMLNDYRAALSALNAAYHLLPLLGPDSARLRDDVTASFCDFASKRRHCKDFELAGQALELAHACASCDTNVQARVLRENALLIWDGNTAEPAMALSLAQQSLQLELYGSFGRALSLRLVLGALLQLCVHRGDGTVEKVEVGYAELADLAAEYTSNVWAPEWDRTRLCTAFASLCKPASLEAAMQCLMLLCDTIRDENCDAWIAMSKTFAMLLLSCPQCCSARGDMARGLGRALRALSGQSGCGGHVTEAATKVGTQISPWLCKLAQVAFQAKEYEQAAVWLWHGRDLAAGGWVRGALALVHWRVGKTSEAHRCLAQGSHCSSAEPQSKEECALSLLSALQLRDSKRLADLLPCLEGHKRWPLAGLAALAEETTRMPPSPLLHELLEAMLRQFLPSRGQLGCAVRHTLLMKFILVTDALATDVLIVLRTLDLAGVMVSERIPLCIGTQKDSGNDEAAWAESRRWVDFSVHAFRIAWRIAQECVAKEMWAESGKLLTHAQTMLAPLNSPDAVEARIGCAVLLAQVRLQRALSMPDPEEAALFCRGAAEEASMALHAARERHLSSSCAHRIAALAEVELKLRLRVPKLALAAASAVHSEIPADRLLSMALHAADCGHNRVAARLLKAFVWRAATSRVVGAALREFVALHEPGASRLCAYREVLSWICVGLEEEVVVPLALPLQDVQCLAINAWNHGAHLHRFRPQEAKPWLQVASRLFECTGMGEPLAHNWHRH